MIAIRLPALSRARLIESGVGGVVAMNYSVLRRNIQTHHEIFYKAMADGQSVSAALDVARLELLMDHQLRSNVASRRTAHKRSLARLVCAGVVSAGE